MTLPPEKLAELEALANKADPDEPWWCCHDGHDINDPNIGDDDRNFIAAANPTAILALIEQHKAMREALETIAAFPHTRDQEMSVVAIRKIARESLNKE